MGEGSFRRFWTGAVAASALGCVLPANDATGIELSWRFLEVNEIDGDDTARARTCSGAAVDDLRFMIIDQKRPDRWGSFSFDCAAGFQTYASFQSEASDAFIRLRGGTYQIETFAAETTTAIDVRTVDVRLRGLTIEAFELAREPEPWTLTLDGAETCQTVRIGLYYDDPEANLTTPSLDDDGTALAVLYRENLVSNRGLSVNNDLIACDQDLTGAHRFGEVDPGRYRLEITVDATTCAYPVVIDGRDPTAVDLANLRCSS